MKKPLLVIFALTLAFSATTQAQTPAGSDNTTVTIKKSDLPPEVLVKLEQQQKMQEVTQNLKTVNEWAGIGKEIGTAIHDGLHAAGEETENFAQTTPGKITMFLIAWKVMAKDVIEIGSSVGKGLKGSIIGIPYLIFIDWFLIHLYYKTTRPQRVLAKEEGEKKIYEDKDTWYTKVDADDSSVIAFQICWWLFAFISNVWLLAGVIL